MLAAFPNVWELIVVVAVVLMLFVVKRLPDLRKGFELGLSNFRSAMDEQAHDAGRSVGGIFGKPAAEALTPDNHTAELYTPAAFRRRRRRRSFRHLLRNLWRNILRWLRIKH